MSVIPARPESFFEAAASHPSTRGDKEKEEEGILPPLKLRGG